MQLLTIDIRMAVPEDAEGIADVHRAACRGTYSGVLSRRAVGRMVNRTRHWWTNHIRESSAVFVVELDGKVCGYATVGHNRVPELKQEGEIYELYLDPACQGQGLGIRLFSEARRWAVREGLDGLVVWVLADNANAVAFYGKAGGSHVAEGTCVYDRVPVRMLAYAWE